MARILWLRMFARAVITRARYLDRKYAEAEADRARAQAHWNNVLASPGYTFTPPEPR